MRVEVCHFLKIPKLPSWIRQNNALGPSVLTLPSWSWNGLKLSPLLNIATRGWYKPVKVIMILKMWTEFPLMYIMKAYIPTCFNEDCANSHAFFSFSKKSTATVCFPPCEGSREERSGCFFLFVSFSVRRSFAIFFSLSFFLSFLLSSSFPFLFRCCCCWFEGVCVDLTF